MVGAIIQEEDANSRVQDTKEARFENKIVGFTWFYKFVKDKQKCGTGNNLKKIYSKVKAQLFCIVPLTQPSSTIAKTNIGVLHYYLTEQDKYSLDKAQEYKGPPVTLLNNHQITVTHKGDLPSSDYLSKKAK